MAVFLIYVGKDKKTGKYPDKDKIDRIANIHRTGQDAVVIKNTNEVFDGGFEVLKEDIDLISFLKHEKDKNIKLDYETLKQKQKIIGIIRNGGKSSRDTSIIDGVKSYRKDDNIADKNNK